MSSRRNREVRNLTRLVNAQARHTSAQARQTEAENARARTSLEEQQLRDAIVRRERYVELIEDQHAHQEVRAFNYLRLLTESTPTPQFEKGL